MKTLRDRRKAPLYRKVNTLARGVWHHKGGDYRHDRNTKANRENGRLTRGMKQGVRRGLDYTPLFRFLLSRVGRDWAPTYAEAQGRLDREDPIWWLVARDAATEHRIVSIGEASYYSGLRVDAENVLRRVDPDLGIEDLRPLCSCCTHTFNGDRFVKPFNHRRYSVIERQTT